MSKKKPKVEQLKMAFTLFFIVGLLLCFWMENSVGAFIVLLVGAMMGGLARDVKYAEQPKMLAIVVPDTDAANKFHKEFQEVINNHPPRRG